MKILIMLCLFVSSAFAQEFKVASHTFKDGDTLKDAQVFNGFGCSGKNISPELHWSGAPAETRAFAVTAYDPDAPTGSGWWHWVVFNLPAKTTGLPEGSGDLKSKIFPKGAIQSRTDFGKAGYGGPCPPVGNKPHRYIFKVFALKDLIPLKADAPAAMVGFYANQMKLAEGTLEAKYGR